MMSMRHIGRCVTSRRMFSSLVSFDEGVSDGIATLTMQRAPVNSMSLELLQEIREGHQRAIDAGAAALMISSGCAGVFSAGLDIMEFVGDDVDRLTKFWRELQATWMELYGSPLAVGASISGSAPAGGCLLALCADVRVMAPGYSIGLNETKLGIVAPSWFCDSLVATVGHRKAESMLSLGQLVDTDEALRIGLIDAIAENPDVYTHRMLLSYAKVNRAARMATKIQLRSPIINKLDVEKDVEFFKQFISGEAVQRGLKGYLAALKAKKSKE